MKLRVLIVALIVAFISGTVLRAADAKAGKDIFDKKCAACHGEDGTGREAIAKMLKVDLPKLGSKEVQAKSDADLHKVVLEGQGKMKPIKDLDAKNVDDVVAFLRTLAKK